jgi:hypothetical protein
MDPVITTRWLLLGGACLVGAALAARRTRREAAREGVPADVARVGSLEGVAEGTVVALHGRLRARGATDDEPLAVTAHDRAGKTWRANVTRLYLALDDGGEVDLDGPVTVRRGSIRAPQHGESGERVRAWVAVLSGLPRRAVDKSVRAVYAVARDERAVVVGRARIEVSAGAHDGTYREARVVRRAVLLPLDDGHVHVYGDAPADTGRIAGATLRGGVKGGLLGALALMGLGALLLRVAAPGVQYRFEGTRMYGVFSGRPWAARWARLSFTAEARAEVALAKAAHLRARHDEASVREALEHAARARDCQLGYDIASAHGLWNEARALSAHCPRVIANREGLADFAAGDLGAASDHLPSRAAEVAAYMGTDTLLTAARVHLLAGDLARAQRVVRAMAVMRPLAFDRSTRSPSPLDGDRYRQTLACVGDHLGFLLDEPSTLASLRNAARPQSRDWCATLYLDARRQRPERAPADSMWELVGAQHVDLRIARDDVTSNRVRSPCGEDWTALLVATDAAMERRWPGVDHALASNHLHGDAAPERIEALCSTAAFEALAGDAAAARGFLDDAYGSLIRAEGPDRAPWHLDASRDVATLRAVVELMAGRDDDARVWRGRARGGSAALHRLDAVLALRAGSRDAEVLLGAERAMPTDNATGWRAVAAGDANALLRQLYTASWNGLGPWILYGAPRVPAARRADLATWVRWNAPAPCVTCSLRQRVVALHERQVASRAYGAPDLDGPPLDALRVALRRRNTAAPLAALDALAGAVLW